MITLCEALQFRHRNQGTAPYSSGAQLLTGDQVINGSHANAEGCGGFALTYEQFGNFIGIHARRFARMRMGLQRTNRLFFCDLALCVAIRSSDGSCSMLPIGHR